MRRLMIVLFGVLFICGCNAAQSTNPKVARIEPDAMQTIPEITQIEMIFVKGGTFTMGCTPEQGEDCSDEEKPAHQVTLSDFSIGKYPVTQAQWKAIMGEDNNPSWIKGDNLPIERVRWEDVQEFINRLNKMTGNNYRLPTEAEWEYAARGGNQSRGYKYSGSNNIDEVFQHTQNNDENVWYNIHPVGTKNANELGIYDMSGNVKERVSDWDRHYTSIPQTNPQGPASGSLHVARGGIGYPIRVSSRGSDITFDGLGFRLASGDMKDIYESDLQSNIFPLKERCNSDARVIVEKFFGYDFEGYWMGSVFQKESWEKLTWENGEIADEGPIFVTNSYHVVSMEEYDDACRLTVNFTTYGYIDNIYVSDEKMELVFIKNPSEEEGTVVVRCLEEGVCRISMAEFDLRPHPGKDIIDEWLEGLYRMRQGTPSEEKEIRDLQEIIRSLP